MCTYNTKSGKIRALRKGEPVAYKAYKAGYIENGKFYSNNGYLWQKGWNVADRDTLTLVDRIPHEYVENFKKTGMLPSHYGVGGGAFHLGATLQDAKAWTGGRNDAVIEVLVRPEDMVAWGRPNDSKDREDIATPRCYVKSLKPVYVWRDEAEQKRLDARRLRDRARRARMKSGTSLKRRKK